MPAKQTRPAVLRPKKGDGVADERKDRIEDVEISPLSDEDLEAVAGGAEEGCSCPNTTGCCTSCGVTGKDEIEEA